MPTEAPLPWEEPPATRQPGQFARSKTGAPWVTHPTESAKGWPGKKADLIALCAQRGISWESDLDIDPGKLPTIAQLQELLGPCPKRVMYGRPSSLGKQIENETNLQKWKERAEGLGIFLEPSLLDVLVDLPPEKLNLDDPDTRDLLDEIAVKAKNRAQAGLAAERGTHIHERTEDQDTERDWIEAANRGEDLGLPLEVQAALVAAWAKMLDHFDIEILAVEASCVDDVWRQAGTLDRICRLRNDTRFVTTAGEYVTLPAGWVGILDIKTGKLRLGDDGFVDHWHGYAVQLASYAQSVPYDPDTDTRSTWAEKLPPLVVACDNCEQTDEHTCHLDGEEYGPTVQPLAIDQRWAIIAHLDILAALDGEAKCRLVLVDLEAGRHAGALCVAARQWEKRRDVFSIPTDDLTVSVPVQFSSAESDVREASVGLPAGSDSAEEQVAAVSPPADESPAPGVLDAGDNDRRNALLDRFKKLSKDAKQAFKMRNVPAADLDSIEALLDELDPPATATTREMAEQRMAADRERPPADRPDEGPPVDDTDFAALRAAYEDLRPEGQQWLGQLIADAKTAGVPIQATNNHTLRRYEIYRGVIGLAGHPKRDEIVLGLVEEATGDEAVNFANVTVGHAIGSLDAAEAARFSKLVDDYPSA